MFDVASAWSQKTTFPHGPHVFFCFFFPPRKASISQVSRFAALIQSIYTEAASLRRSSCGNKCTVEALIFRRLEELCMRWTLLKRPVAHYFLILGKLCVIVYAGVCACVRVCVPDRACETSYFWPTNSPCQWGRFKQRGKRRSQRFGDEDEPGECGASDSPVSARRFCLLFFLSLLLSPW